jgi:hypothetical protein
MNTRHSFAKKVEAEAAKRGKKNSKGRRKNK